MQGTDLLFCRLLSDAGVLAAGERNALISFWESKRNPNESLLAFIRRLRWLSKAADHRLQQFERGTLVVSRLGDLLTSIEIVDLIRFVHQLRALRPEPPTTSATTTNILDTPRSATILPKSVLPEIGKTWDRYLILNRIGSGASSLVFRALHPDLQRMIALKIPHPNLLKRDGGLRDHFLSEGRMLALVDHPNVVRVLDFAQFEGLPYLILEYVDGISLHELISTSGRMQWQRALHIGRQIAAGLAALHAKGIIHRDVKPANVLITRDGVAKLTDFGLAARATVVTPNRSHTATLVGTIGYTAPEMAGSETAVDMRADMYSLGVVCYEMLTGYVPFRADSLTETIRRQRQEPPPSVRAVVPEVPIEFEQLLMRLLAKEPHQRYASDIALLEAFDEVGAAEGVSE